MAERRECQLFVYGTLRQGEARHALLAGARLLGMATTLPAFYLVDVGPYAALVRGGKTAVTGELYVMDLETRGAIDVERQVPILFTREKVQLADAADTDAYLLTNDQVRGRRRLAHGDWKKRFSRSISPHSGGPWAAWARGRWTK
jgi:gamma-glutamylaminecyclotransferase